MMKKILFAAAALVAFAACTNDDVVSKDNGPAIAFDNAFVENTTRAAQDISKDNLANFGVYGSVTKGSSDGLIFENTVVTKNGDAYTYSPAQYWVDDATYNFVALAPHTNAKWSYMLDDAKDAKNGHIAFDNENAAGEQDLLFASANRTTASITSAPAPVAFTFNHLLSRVKFSFTNGFVADSNIELKVTDVKIVNAHKVGELLVEDGVVAQNWTVADNAVADYTFVRLFGDLDVEKLAEGGSGETAHYYLIPANAEYTVTFDVEIFQAGVSLKKTTRQAVVSLDMAKGYSYNVKATLNDKNASADGELYPIEFTVDAVEDWADYVTTPLGWDGVTVSEPSYDAATETYSVGSATELAWIAGVVNGTITRATDTFDGKNIVLTNDIDLQNYQWKPIGYWETFDGTFDGQGHTISNLTHIATEADCYIGLFGCTNNATIKNVNLHNVNIKLPFADNTWAGGHIGALVGYPDGETLIENVNVTGYVRIEGDITKKGAQRIGGVVGGFSCKSVEMNNVKVDVAAGSYVKGNIFIGGVAGSPLGTVKMTNVESNIDVFSQEGIVGGIIGYAGGNSSFTNVKSSGNVTRLHTAADATVNQWLRIGGIVGSWECGSGVVTLTDCEYTGTLSAVNNAQKPFNFLYGGLCGGAYFESTPGTGKLVIDGEEQTMQTVVNTVADLMAAVKVKGAIVIANPCTERTDGAYYLTGRLSLAEGVSLIGNGVIEVKNDWGSTLFANQAHFTNTHMENIYSNDNMTIDAAIANGNVSFKNCTFGGSSVAHQGVHFDSGNAVVTFDDCAFIGRNMLGSSLENVVFNNCEFINKRSSQTAADLWTGVNMWGKCEFNNCVFGTEAHCNVKCDGVVAAFNGCRFTDGRDITTLVNGKDKYNCTVTFN